MRLKSLKIASFRNLKDFSTTFDEMSPYTVLIGSNGSGKSNLIEALSWIFRNLDLGEFAPFDYEIEYECRNRDVRVIAEGSKRPRFFRREKGMSGYKRLSANDFMREEDGAPLYRPAFVFGYYSGPSDRLNRIYATHQRRFYSKIIEDRSDDSLGDQDTNIYRRLFYALTLHGQFALIAFFMGDDERARDDRAFLKDYLGISDLESVLFGLKKPPWSEKRKAGDPRFWNAVGQVQLFLSHLYEKALLPLAIYSRNNRPKDRLYLFLKGKEDLQSVYHHYGNQYDFFTALESMYLSEVLDGVHTRIRLSTEDQGGNITYRDLSEGEQQLLLVLGLLKFTARSETLFLLDEPDTHLNPQWSAQYLTFLDRFIAGRDSCHIVMSTHDPLVIAGREKSEVKIFNRDDSGNISVEPPDQDPKGMGVAAILTSDLFGLRSTLDPETQGDLDRLRELETIESLTPIQVEEIAEVRTRLASRGFQTAHRDPTYQEFLKAWIRHESPSWRSSITLTDEERAERARLASRIVEQLRTENES